MQWERAMFEFSIDSPRVQFQHPGQRTAQPRSAAPSTALEGRENCITAGSRSDPITMNPVCPDSVNGGRSSIQRLVARHDVIALAYEDRDMRATRKSGRLKV